MGLFMDIGGGIIRIAKELVQNTGYDEYSLLSLSSNDYANINETIKELSIDFKLNSSQTYPKASIVDNFVIILSLKALLVKEGSKSGHVSIIGASILLIDAMTVLAMVLISFFEEAKVDNTNNLILSLFSFVI